MPIKCARDGFIEEKTLYAPLIEYAVMVQALDNFFDEVVQGNVPLVTDNGVKWWERQIVAERVNRYSQNWCVMFECLAHLRGRLEEQGIYADQITIDPNLRFSFKSNRRSAGPEPIEWTAERV
jgi:hypothetical protein